MNIEIEKPFAGEVEIELLEHAAQTTLDYEDIPNPVDLTIRITDDAELQHLNNEFLGIDAPTDVLSFPSNEVDPATGVRYLGDIAISYPRAAEQAAQAGHITNAELELLVVHGILHLLGYDHAEPKEKERMWTVQGQVLQLLGNPIKDIPE